MGVADVELTVSELVTNAVVHGGGVRAVVMTLDTDAGVTVRVVDDTCVPPIPVSAPDADGGRGMLLVAALAQAWGVDTAPGGGKAVWAWLGVPPPAGGASCHRLAAGTAPYDPAGVCCRNHGIEPLAH